MCEKWKQMFTGLFLTPQPESLFGSNDVQLGALFTKVEIDAFSGNTINYITIPTFLELWHSYEVQPALFTKIEIDAFFRKHQIKWGRTWKRRRKKNKLNATRVWSLRPLLSLKY